MKQVSAPADVLLRPAPLLALLVLALNDHVLKGRWPGPITGKLSDLAGMVCFPLLLVALVELLAPGAAPFRPSRRTLGAACVATGVGFALVKTWEPAGALWAWTWGTLRWPLLGLLALAHGELPPRLAPVALVRDLTDLIALPLILVAWRVGGRRVRDATDAGRQGRASPPPERLPPSL